MKSITIEGQLKGPHLAKEPPPDLLSQGSVPVVIYGVQRKSTSKCTDAYFKKKLVYTPNFQLVNTKVDGNSIIAFRKTWFDKVTDELIHVDFWNCGGQNWSLLFLSSLPELPKALELVVDLFQN